MQKRNQKEIMIGIYYKEYGGLMEGREKLST